MTNYCNFIKDLSDEQVEAALKELRKELYARKAAKADDNAAPNATDNESTKATDNATPNVTDNESAKATDNATGTKFEEQMKGVVDDAIEHLALVAKRVTVRGNIDASKKVAHWENGSSTKVSAYFNVTVEIG